MTDENPVIAEIRKTREQMLAKHHGDLDSLVDELQRQSAARTSSAKPTMPPSQRLDGVQPARSKKVG